MSTMPATVVGWALRAIKPGIWYPESGVASTSSVPSGYLYSDTTYISSPTGDNKYTAMIAVSVPNTSTIDTISELSVTFSVWDRNPNKGTLYGSLRTVSQSNGSSTSDTASTFREDAIGSEASISDIGMSSTSRTMSFSGSFIKGGTYYLFIYTKSTNDIYALDIGSSNFSAEITYSKKSYTVTYDANGGSGAPASQPITPGSTITISTVRPTKANSNDGSYTVTLNPNGGTCSTANLSSNIITSYSFSHWNTKSDGSGISYASGSTYAREESIALYAIYSSSTSAEAVTIPTPTRDGYDFSGWSESADGTPSIRGNYTPKKNITLYAIWGANGFVYIYDGSGFSPYQIFIYNGSGWDMYCPYVYDGASWTMCS